MKNVSPEVKEMLMSCFCLMVFSIVFIFNCVVCFNQ